MWTTSRQALAVDACTGPEGMAFSPAIHRLSDRCPCRTETDSYFHLHLVSDATGETLITVARAAAAQYTNMSPVEHIYPLVRTQKQLDRVLAEIEEVARHRALHAARRRPGRAAGGKLPRARPAVPFDPRPGAAGCSSPISAPRPTHRVGAQHTLNAEYFKRIDALNYTMLHDDGQHTDDLEEADVVLVGVSRTSKTPTSIYLANRGVKTANVPLVPGVPVPPQLETLTQPLVVGLYASPERIVQIRQNRLLGLQGRSRRRPVYRPPGGGRGGRVLAQALRQAQLADHRRDAPLDRGNRRGGDDAAGRAPPAAGRPDHAALACSDSRWCCLEERRRGARCWRPPASRSRSCRPTSTSAAIEAQRRRDREPAKRRRLLAREKARAVSQQHAAAGWCSAPTRRWRSASGGSPSRPTAPRRASSLRALRGKTHALHSAVARGARRRTCCSSMRDAARLTMRAFSDEFLDSYLDAAGDAVTASVGGYQLESVGIQLFERDRGRPFHHSRPAAVAAARWSAARRACWRVETVRSVMFILGLTGSIGMGKIDHGALVRRSGRAGARRRRRGASAL